MSQVSSYVADIFEQLKNKTSFAVATAAAATTAAAASSDDDNDSNNDDDDGDDDGDDDDDDDGDGMIRRSRLQYRLRDLSWPSVVDPLAIEQQAPPPWLSRLPPSSSSAENTNINITVNKNAINILYDRLSAIWITPLRDRTQQSPSPAFLEAYQQIVKNVAVEIYLASIGLHLSFHRRRPPIPPPATTYSPSHSPPPINPNKSQGGNTNRRSKEKNRSFAFRPTFSSSRRLLQPSSSSSSFVSLPTRLPPPPPPLLAPPISRVIRSSGSRSGSQPQSKQSNVAIPSPQKVVIEREEQREEENEEEEGEVNDDDDDGDNDILSRLGAYVSIKEQGRGQRRPRQQASSHHHRHDGPLSDTIINNVLSHWTIGQDPTLYSWTETCQQQRL